MNLELKHVSFGYHPEQILFQDLSFTVAQGSVVSILGSNGSGKTTLLKCILDILEFQEGTITIDGQPVTKKQRQKIAYVPQAHTMQFSLNAEETIVMGRSRYMNIFSQPNQKDYQAAYEIMEKLGITHLRHKLTSRLSGGELQLVLIGRALVSDPSMLIMDEPETGLDFRHQAEILQLIQQISQNQNISVIFNTHYPEHALNIADKTLLFQKNEKYLFGNTKDVLTEENMSEAFGIAMKIVQTLVKDDIYYTIIPVHKGDITNHE